VLDGGIQHLPILSKGVVVLAGLLIAAIAGLVFALLRTDAVRGAAKDDIAPEPPVQLVAEPVADSVQLRWAPSDRAQAYKVQQVDDAGAALTAAEVKDGATAYTAKFDQPLTTACFVVTALRGELASAPSERKCATTGDGKLPPPTDVRVVQVADGYNVAWTDTDQNDHAVLANGAVVGNVSPAPSKNVTIPLPAGKQCITVVARKGAQSSPESAPPQCVAVTPPPAAAPPSGVGITPSGPPGATPGAQVPGGLPPGGGAPTGQNAPGVSGAPGVPGTGAAAALGAFVAVLGPPYQERALAESTVKLIQAAAPQAQIVDAAALPALRFRPPTVVIVVPGFPTLAAAQQFCTQPRPAGFPPGCVPAPTGS
jgi:hypothetical protein